MSAQEVVTHSPGEDKEPPNVSMEERALVFEITQMYGPDALGSEDLPFFIRALSRSKNRENLELLAQKDAIDKRAKFELFREGGMPSFNVTYVPEDSSHKAQHAAFTQEFGIDGYSPWDDPQFETEQIVLTYDDVALYRKCHPDSHNNPHTIQYYARRHGDTDTTRPDPVIEQ
jgi:hypothetical protein